MNKYLFASKTGASYLIAGLVLAVLSACGGGGVALLADGIGGTGITSVGRITGFGSVYVNGVHFNTDGATFTRDDNGATQQEFRVGEIVKVEGRVNADGKTGVATKVVYADTLEGPVTRAVQGKSIEILGQTVLVDNLTVLHGFKTLADLEEGNIVEVSGFIDAQGRIEASSLSLQQVAFEAGIVLEVEGEISQLDTQRQTFKIGELDIQYTAAHFVDLSPETLRDGVFVIVSADQDLQDNILLASRIASHSAGGTALEVDGIYEVEGVVSELSSPTRFKVGSLEVITDGNTEYANGLLSDLHLDAEIIVTGSATAPDTLQAERIEFIDTSVEVVLQGSLDAVDIKQGSITVAGQQLVLDASTLLSDDTSSEVRALSLEDFYVGESVFVVVNRYADGRLLVARMSKIDALEANLIWLMDELGEYDVAQGTFNLFANTVMVDGTTLFFDSNDNEITQADFFAQLQKGLTIVDAEGMMVSAGFIQADMVYIVVP